MSGVLASDAAEPVKLFVIFTVLTAARFSEAAEAVWTELNEAEASRNVPADRMKPSRDHYVP